MTRTKKFLIIVLTFPITLTLYIFLFTGNIKYSEEIEINSNIDSLIVLFDNPYNMKEYMDGIEDYKLISGELRKVGAKAEQCSFPFKVPDCTFSHCEFNAQNGIRGSEICLCSSAWLFPL